MTYELPAPDLYGPDGNSVKMLRYYTADTLRAEVAAAEKRGADDMRERCVQVCDEYDGSWYVYRKGAQECAAEIRSLE